MKVRQRRRRRSAASAPASNPADLPQRAPLARRLLAARPRRGVRAERHKSISWRINQAAGASDQPLVDRTTRRRDLIENGCIKSASIVRRLPRRVFKRHTGICLSCSPCKFRIVTRCILKRSRPAGAAAVR